MGALDDIIFNALGGAAKPDFAAGDPYAEPGQFVTSTLQAPILQAALKPDKGGYSTGELIGGALISGLLGGGLSGLSKDYQDTQKGLYRDYLLGGLLSGNPQASPDLEPSLLDVGNQNLSLFGVVNALDQKRAKQALATEREKSIIEAIAKNPYAADKVVSAIGKYTGETKPAVVQPGDVGASVSPASEPQAGPKRTVEGGLLDEMQRETQKLMETGAYTPAQASEAVTAAFKGKREQMSKQYERIQESSKAGQELSNLADSMEYALGHAGYTGAYGDTAQSLAGIRQFLNEDQAKKYAAGKDVKSLGIDVIKSTGKVLKGPMSDADIRLMLSAGPELSNPAETNASILGRWRYAAALQNKYSDFMQEALDKAVPVADAERAWRELVKSNPYLIRNQAGELVPNTQWQEALTGESQSGGLGDVKPIGGVETRTLKSGATVRVQKMSNGKYMQVE